MTAEILSLVPAVLAWTALAYKLPAFRRNRQDPSVRAFALSLFFLALALTVLLPPVALWIDRVAGLANLSRLLGNSVVLIAAWAVQLFVFRTLDYRGDGARSRIQLASWALVAVLIAMSALFALAPVHREAAEFWQRYSTAPLMLEYRLVYLAYMGLAVINIVRHSWRYAGMTDQPSLSLGLRVLALGGLLGGGYVAHEGLRSVAVAFGTDNAFLDSDTVTRVLIAGSVALMVAGVTMPAWGPRVGMPAVYHGLGRYQTYRQLYPLWHALYRANPEIGLLPVRSALADALTIRDLDFRLYRRIVEIRDGSLALRPYLEPWVVRRASELSRFAGVPDAESRAVIEAASLATALYARKLGRPPHSAVSRFELSGGGDVSSEAAVLVRVARCFRRSPIVATIVAEMKDGARTPTSGVELPVSRR